MWYIRFLKAPKVAQISTSIYLDIIVTITTDLGDCFYPHNAILYSFVRLENNSDKIIKKSSINWKPGYRCAKSSIQLSVNEVSDLLNIYVTDEPEEKMNDNLSPFNIRAIHAISTAPIDLNNSIATVENLARRTLHISNSTEVTIWEDIGESIARHIWDSGLALSAYLCYNISNNASSQSPFTEQLRSKTKLQILELGCGCGVVGISMAHIRPNCRIILTDLQDASELAIKNANSAVIPSSSSLCFHALDWEGEVYELPSDSLLDAILISDCTYNPDSSPALVRTIKLLSVQSPGAIVIVAMKIRHPAELIFFDLMRSEGFVEQHQQSISLPGSELGEETASVHFFCWRNGER